MVKSVCLQAAESLSSATAILLPQVRIHLQYKRAHLDTEKHPTQPRDFKDPELTQIRLYQQERDTGTSSTSRVVHALEHRAEKV